jgi:hypothetical protein
MILFFADTSEIKRKRKKRMLWRLKLKKTALIPLMLTLYFISCSSVIATKTNFYPSLNRGKYKIIYYKEYDNFTGRLFKEISREALNKGNIKNYTAVFIDKKDIIRKKEWVYLGRNIISEYFNKDGKISVQIIKHENTLKKAFFIYYCNRLSKIKVYHKNRHCHSVVFNYDGNNRLKDKRVVDTKGRLTFISVYKYFKDKVLRYEYFVDMAGSKEITGYYVALLRNRKIEKDAYYMCSSGHKIIYSKRYFDKQGRITKGILYSKTSNGRPVLKSIYKNGKLFHTLSYHPSGKVKKIISYAFIRSYTFKRRYSLNYN